MIDENGLKHCKKCDTKKCAETEFYKASPGQNGDGYDGQCKECRKAKAKKWAIDNQEKKSAMDKARQSSPEYRAKRSEKNKEKYANDPAYAKQVKERLAQWAKENPDKVRESQQRWRIENPDKVAEAQRKYHSSKEWRDHHAMRERMRRSLYDMGWMKVCHAFDYSCCYCGDSQSRLDTDHLTPLSRGGKHEIGNIAPCCTSCNSIKKRKTLEEFAPEKAEEIRRKARLE